MDILKNQRFIFVVFFLVFLFGGIFLFVWNRERVLNAQKKPVEITIFDNGLEMNFQTSEETVEDCVSSVDLNLKNEDKIFPSLDEEVRPGLQIFIKRAREVTVSYDNKKEAFYSISDDVLDLLSEQDISLAPLDKVIPSKNTPLYNGLKVTITRVKEAEIKEKKEISFKTVHENDSSMLRGKTKVVQNGIKGSGELVYKITYENGKEVKRVLVSNSIKKRPQDKIIKKGTKLLIGKVLKGEASWYCRGCGMIAASRDFAPGTTLRVSNLANSKSVFVRVSSFGPAYRSRILDLSYEAFAKIGSPYEDGVISVRVEQILN